MKTTLFAGAACAVVFCFAGVAAGAAKKPAGKMAKPEAASMSAADLKWGDAPPNLPKGAQLTVLHGNPGAKGPFIVRLKMPDGYKIAPHWHTSDENLTILSGTFIMHLGDTMDAPAHTLEAGGYHFLPGKMHHAAETKGETILELHSMGPFDIHYLNRADDPTPKAASAAKK
jgi:mannose-6-phosphate isomerase-like protein (cupin superfamily)